MSLRNARQARPPGTKDPGGLARVRPLKAALAVALAVAVGGAALAVPAAVGAQVVRGTVRTLQDSSIVAAARVTATDSADKPLIETRSDARGRFQLDLRGGVPFKLAVAKVGWLPSSSDLIKAKATDTLELDITVPADPVALNTVEVNAPARKSPNQIAYEEAKRHGWKVYTPDLIEKHRGDATDFIDLMRGVGTSGLVLSQRDCIRSVRFNRCMTYVVDGMPAGTSLYMPPRDVYFFAVLSATESAAQWGDKAPWGAVVIYTRMYGDKRHP